VPPLLAGPPPVDTPWPIAAGEVHLSYASTALLDDGRLADAYRALLTPDETRRLAAFQVEGARRQHLLTRALVRCALSRHAAVPPASWRFRANAHGRPEIEAPPEDLRFNASNSADLVVCAVTRGAMVGVDVEPHASAASVAALASRVFSASEIDALAALPEKARAAQALSLWTAKEAYAKALGLGLSLPPRSVTLAIHGSRVALERGPDAASAARWRFALLDVSGHRIALAVDAGPLRLELWQAVPLVGFERRPVGDPDPSSDLPPG
jgi:4'-phosphopantetheinyl transferase